MTIDDVTLAMHNMQDTLDRTRCALLIMWIQDLSVGMKTTNEVIDSVNDLFKEAYK